MTGLKAPKRCPLCGHNLRVHGPPDRFPSTYVSRISLKLHRTPPLNV